LLEHSLSHRAVHQGLQQRACQFGMRRRPVAGSWSVEIGLPSIASIRGAPGTSWDCSPIIRCSRPAHTSLSAGGEQRRQRMMRIRSPWRLQKGKARKDSAVIRTLIVTQRYPFRRGRALPPRHRQAEALPENSGRALVGARGAVTPLDSSPLRLGEASQH